MRFRLRTLLIVLALGPPVLAVLIVIGICIVNYVRAYRYWNPPPTLPPVHNSQLP